MGGSSPMMRSKNIVILALSLVILLTVAFIFGNSLKGPEESSEQSGRVVKFLRPILDPYERLSVDEFSHIVRKSAHFLEYCLLGFELAVLGFYVTGRVTISGLTLSAFGCLLTADIDEFIQSFTGRGSAVADVLLDFSGGLTGIAMGIGTSCLAAYLLQKRSKEIK